VAVSADVKRLQSIAPEYAAKMAGYQKRNFMLLVIDGATFAFAVSLLSETTIIPAFVAALTGSSLLVGLVAATFAVGRYLPQLLGAHLVMGRAKRKPLFLVIIVAERVGILAIAMSATLIDALPNTAVLLIFFVSFGFYAITTGLIGPVYGDFVAKALTKARGWFFGTVQLLGGILGFTAAIWAESILRAQGFPEGNQTLFWTSFALSAISVGFVVALKEEPYPHVQTRPRFSDTLREIPKILRVDNNFRRFLGARAMMALSTLGVGFVVVDGLVDRISASDVAVLAAVFILSQAIIGFLLGMVGNYWGWRIVVLTGGVLIALGMAGAVIADSLLSYVAVFIALGGANAVTVIGDPNMSIEMASTSRTGLYIGTTSTLLAPFFIFGPLIAGVLVPVVGYNAIFLAALALAVVSVILAIRIREPRKSEAVTTGEIDIITVVSQPGAQP
jgi:MFS family permease